jgi:hypothetical protein
MPAVAPVEGDPFVEPVDYDPFFDKVLTAIGDTAEQILNTMKENESTHRARHAEMMAALMALTEAVAKPRRIRLKRNPDGSASEAISE